MVRNRQDLDKDKITNWEIKVDYDSGTNPVYVGKAKPGTLTSVSQWQIFKLTWDGNDNPTLLAWANDTDDFDKEWDERSSYF